MYRFFLVTISVGLLSGAGAVRQRGVELELSAATGAPGKVAVLPLLMRIADDEQVGRVEFTTEFPLSLLKFKNARLIQGAEAKSLSLEHRIESIDGERQVVTLEIAGQVPVAAGELMRLILDIQKEAPEQSVLLPTRARAWSSPSGSELDVDTLDGIVVIDPKAATPVFGCFFYMH